MFGNKPLFEREKFEIVKKEIGRSVIFCSINSAIGFLLICDVVKNNINMLSLDDLMSFVSNNLLNEKLIDDIYKDELCVISDYDFINQDRHEIYYTPSEQFFSDISSTKCELLQAKFFYYYFTRLPIMLRMTRFGAKKSIPNRTEQKEILEACIDALEFCYPQLVKKFPHIFSDPNVCYDLSREVEKAKQLTGFLSKNTDRDNFVYEYTWIFRGPTRTEKDLLPIENQVPNFDFIMQGILDKYFRVFWNTLRDYYADHIYFKATWY